MRRYLPSIFFLLLAVFLLAPLVLVIVASFKIGGNPWSSQPYALNAYAKALSTPRFIKGAVNSLTISLVSAFIATVLATAAAYAIDRGSFRGKSLLKTLFIAPLSIPNVVIGMAFFIFYLVVFRPLFDTVVGITILHVFLLLPFLIAIIGTGMAGIDLRLEEAARDLGDTAFQAILRINVPLLSPVLLAAMGVAFIISFDEIDATLFLVRSSVTTLPIEVFKHSMLYQDGVESAVSVLLLVATVTVGGLFLGIGAVVHRLVRGAAPGIGQLLQK